MQQPVLAFIAMGVNVNVKLPKVLSRPGVPAV